MRLTCPACGATHSLESLLADTHAREAVSTALALPAGLADRVLRYLSLFRPPQRALSWDRAAKLLAELNTDIAAGQIKRDGRIWAAPLAIWIQAFDATLDARSKLVLPLKNHGYLYAIIAGIGSSAEARAEAKIEAQRHRPREATMTIPAALVPGPAPIPSVSPESPEARGEKGFRRAKPPLDFLRAAGLGGAKNDA